MSANTVALRPRLKAEERREKVTTGYLQGVRAEDMARRYGVSRKTIFQDLATVKKRLIAKQVANAEEHQRLMIAHFEEVIRQAWRGWRRSLRDAESEAVTTGDAPKTTTTTKGQAGDPSFLSEIIKALWRICELRGLTGRDRDSREEADRQIQPLVGLIINSREELEMIKNLQSMTIEQAKPFLPAPASNGHVAPDSNGHSNGHFHGEDDDAD